MKKIYKARLVTNCGQLDVVVQTDILRSYHGEIEQLIESGAAEFSDYVEAAAKKIGGDQCEQEWLENKQIESSEYEELYPQLARKSLFLLSYAAFEHLLWKLADYSHRDGLSDKAPSQSNFYAHDAKEYFLNDVSIEKDAFGSLWDQLEKYRKVRNILVHDGGHPSPSGGGLPTLQMFVLSHSGSKLDPDAGTVLGDSWCPEFIDQTEKQLNEILKFVAAKFKSS